MLARTRRAQPVERLRGASQLGIAVAVSDAVLSWDGWGGLEVAVGLAAHGIGGSISHLVADEEQRMKAASSAAEAGDRFWLGFVRGLAPLGVTLAALGAALLGLGATRVATASAGFFALQQALGIMVPVGLAVMALCYAGACVWALRAAGRCSRAGQDARAAGALWGLAVSALLLALPVALALALPQRPAFG